MPPWPRPISRKPVIFLFASFSASVRPAAGSGLRTSPTNTCDLTRNIRLSSQNRPTPTHRQCLHHQAHLSQRAQTNPLAEHVVIVPLDGIEQTAIGPPHDEKDCSPRPR